MENFFITEYFDWKIERASNIDRALNLPLRWMGLRFRFKTAQIFDKSVYALTGKSFSPIRSGIGTSIEQRINMYHFVSQVIAYNVEGDIVELGCNEGQSAVLIQKLIEGLGSSKRLHLYDSFEGLPAISVVDGTSYKEGDLATTENVVRQNFSRYSLHQPIIHKGWFKDTLPTQLPEKISFAHLDGDLYDSILVSLQHTYPRLAKGAICLIDDYCDPAVYPDGWNYLPGVKKACDEFLSDKPERITYLYSGTFSHGFFRKP
jgi:O-methyltransferase